MNYDIIIQRNYDIINQKASHHLMPSVPPSRTLFACSPRYMAGHPPPHPSKSAIFAKLRGQNAIFESSNLAYKYGSLPIHFIQKIQPNSAHFSARKSVREKGGERVREITKFLESSLGYVRVSLGRNLKIFSAHPSCCRGSVSRGNPEKKVWVLSGNQGASFGCEFQAEKSS